ncbi:MAG: PAS domain S-box protein [Acetobacteraceae bacterium]|nr:MAG: PAS domain S-box protein [Acetobacteraceae bacterium]
MFDRFSRKPVSDNRTTALDALRASVMLADPDLNITYLNASARGLLQEAEAELRRELPRFEMAKLVGSNIDIFHKQPSHQRGMLAAMKDPHQATITVGNRIFDLLVTPLLEGGQRVGFAVEWTDARERLLNLDLAAQLTALNRSHAVVTFDADGIIQDANANFLACMGYALEEVRGKPHSIFVEPALRDGPAYRAFWDSLRRGEYQAAQFKRIGKGGRDVWIEGAYNPIRDRNGTVVKVVKFATDVTAQARLLANLTHNLGEIDGAIELSTDGTQAAATAAEETSANVQTVAASAEELAASIDEISASMARDRAATDSAFDRTVAVGRNTDQLAGAAQAMGGIVGLIRNIASQINLLALNATIEAARAGDAGKGFAVVASEVKSLAVQAARATEQISGEIDGIQGISLEVASALGAIREAVTTVRESVTLTASAVEEQSAVTRGMSASMQTAAGAVTTISANVNSIAAAVLQAGQAVSKTKEAAQVLAR